MSRQLNRYQLPEVIDHLASNYVLGTLSSRVRQRMERLLTEPDYRTMQQRVSFWEEHMAPLNDNAPDLAPKATTWEAIQAQIAPGQQSQASAKKGSFSFFGIRFYQFAAAFSFALVAVLGLFQLQQPTSPGTLSYVAVLADDTQTPQLVAATYGESQTLMLDILSTPDIDAEESLELWVTSKTDKQTRSLGLIPMDTDSFSRQLTVAEWRLIKDSDSLLITIEEAGGSPIGEPMGRVVSKGACVRLSGWQENA